MTFFNFTEPLDSIFFNRIINIHDHLKIIFLSNWIVVCGILFWEKCGKKKLKPTINSEIIHTI